MKIKRFFAKDMRSALNEVKEELGVDAVIMSNKKMADGVEIVAAVDYDRNPTLKKPADLERKKSKVDTSIVRPKPVSASPEPQGEVADSLEALLSRQSKKTRNTRFTEHLEQTLAKENKHSEQNPAWSEELRNSEIPPQYQELATNKLNSSPNTKDNAEKQQISAMQEEMSAIRQLLEHQVSGLMTQDFARRDPTKACMIDKLKAMGISHDVAEQMACFIPDDVSEKKAWQALLNMVQSQLHTTNNEILRSGGVYALVGPTGVGKTTTVAKLAALGAQKFGEDNVALITTDTYRIGAYEQLATYGRIIGCPVKQVKDANELSDVLYQLRNKRLILIDTAGMSQRDLRLTEQLNTLMKNVRVDIKSYLVLSATVQVEVLQETVKQFKKIKLTGCIFTKLDESLSLGEIMSIAIQNRLPIGYLTNGQRVPEDIRVANAEKLVKKAEQLYVRRENIQYQKRSDLAFQPVGMYD